ncbi:hypothetical protein D3C80_691330 [compost metagenome]
MDVVRCGERHRSRRFTHRDGDGLAVGQFHHQIGTGDLVVDRRGVGHYAALDHALRGGQGDGSGVYGVGDLGHSCSAADVQLLEVATGGAGDSHAQVFGIEVHVIAWGIDGDRRFLRAGRNGDRLAVAQLDHQVGAGLVGQGGGVGDLAAFGHCRRSRQGQEGGVLRVWSVCDGGADRCLVQGQLFKLPRVCTADRVDRIDDRLSAYIDVIRRGHGDRAGGAVGRH